MKKRKNAKTELLLRLGSLLHGVQNENRCDTCIKLSLAKWCSQKKLANQKKNMV